MVKISIRCLLRSHSRESPLRSHWSYIIIIIIIIILTSVSVDLNDKYFLIRAIFRR